MVCRGCLFRPDVVSFFLDEAVFTGSDRKCSFYDIPLDEQAADERCRIRHYCKN